MTHENHEKTHKTMENHSFQGFPWFFMYESCKHVRTCLVTMVTVSHDNESSFYF